jgi:hypothetical protein
VFLHCVILFNVFANAKFLCVDVCYQNCVRFLCVDVCADVCIFSTSIILDECVLLVNAGVCKRVCFSDTCVRTIVF